MDRSVTWVLFSYRVPYETSTLRVRTWRILRRIGALSLQQSFYIVPNTLETTRKLRQLRGLIEEGKGIVTWLDVEQFAGESTERLVQLFNEARSTEYDEFLTSCSSLSENYTTPGAMSESELKRLKKWFRKLQARDYFGCPKQEDAEQCLQKIEQRFSEPVNG